MSPSLYPLSNMCPVDNKHDTSHDARCRDLLRGNISIMRNQTLFRDLRKTWIFDVSSGTSGLSSYSWLASDKRSHLPGHVSSTFPFVHNSSEASTESIRYVSIYVLRYEYLEAQCSALSLGLTTSARNQMRHRTTETPYPEALAHDFL